MNRRSFLASAAALASGARHGILRGQPIPILQERPVPSASQLLWQRDEHAIFVHFGINTFTGREWGDGSEDPAIFDPTSLDARSWARAAREAGFRAMVLTAKHHDGFCLWPTATTDHSVASSPWRGGEGDLVREFVDACRAEGLRPGLYCSPWDRNAPVYGDSPRYNDMFVEQLTELLTRYGPIHEVWFDGANGEGPNGRRQEYDWPRFWGLVRRLQPEAVMFSDAGPDIRWIGNEIGSAGDPNWSPVDPSVVPEPGISSPRIMEQLQHGDRDGTVWRPGETDVSIRPGWFYHAEEDADVRSVENLVDLHFTSVGRNSKLLLNVPPMPSGRFHETDVARLSGMRRALDRLFEEDLMARVEVSRADTGPRDASFRLDLGTEREVGVSALSEDIRGGQSATSYRLDGMVDGDWRTLAEGITVGYRKLDRFDLVQTRHLRLHIEDGWQRPRDLGISLYQNIQ